MKFLVIDDNPRSRAKLVEFIQAKRPDQAVQAWDPLADGLPGDDFDWSGCALVLLDQDLRVTTGLDWLEERLRRGPLPPVILLSTNPDPQLAVQAIKAGAENYVAKRGLNADRLEQVIAETLQQTVAEAGVRRGPGREAPRVIHLQRPSAAGLPDIPGHRLIKKIGQGGMSAIYLAERLADGQQVVVKTLHTALAENKKTILRSHQEFKLISRIRNPHIVRLYEHGTVGDVLYTTMEYFPKGDLKQRLRQGVQRHNALRYLRQIAEGLNAIHGCGVIHRDLKPGNIMFRDDDSLAIIDFGISKDINSTLDLTEPGQIMGTPNYMAPEQGNSGYKPDARSDIYSLGVMFYEMLTGKKPYAAATSAAIIYKHLHDPIPQLPNRYFELQVLIDRMMAKFPHQRFQSAYDLLQFLDEHFRLDLSLDFDRE